MLFVQLAVGILATILGLVSVINNQEQKIAGAIFIVAGIVLIILALKKMLEMKKLGAIWIDRLKHLTGLPIAENVICKSYYTKDNFVVNGANQQFSIANAKISDMTITNSTDIQKSYVSSIGGAVGGAVLFGAVGAMIGGRAKEKTSKVESYFLVITYTSGDETKYIAFDITEPKKKASANKLVKLFKKGSKSGSVSKSVEL